jgi:hypothetical protein
MIIEGMHYNPNCNCKQCVKTTKLNNPMTQKCCEQFTNQDWKERWKLLKSKWRTDEQELDFIQQELDSKENEVRSEIRGKIKLMEIYDIDDTSLTPIAMHGYNQAIKYILEKI